MAGRDPGEAHRSATNLELFFDLTFVVVFSIAGVQLADAVAEGHFRAATIGFGFCSFAALWAWINFTWMASAFDTDDWLFRLVTMVQMVGVCILALGVEPVFRSLAAGDPPDNRVVVLGYVVMRVALIAQWARIAVSSPRYRRTAVRYIVAIVFAQVGWVLTAVLPLRLLPLLALSALLYALELLGPYLAEKVRRTPWHPHHIAERYGALTIVTLGEGVVGMIVALQSLVTVQGWSPDVAAFGLGAMVINLALWWIYFSIPVGRALAADPGKCFSWGYGHMVVFMAIAAFGAGLHVVALAISHDVHVGSAVVAQAFVVPLAMAVVGIAVVDAYLTGVDRRRVAAVGVTLVLMGLAVVAVLRGAGPLSAVLWCAAAMVVQVVVEELWVARRRERRLA